MNKGFNFLKLYLLLATIVGLFGTIIAYGIAVYSSLEYAILTDEEYISSSNNKREIDNCTHPHWRGDTSVERSTEEKDACITEVTERLIKARTTTFKINLLQGGVRGTIFLILFLTHYPKFRKEQG